MSKKAKTFADDIQTAQQDFFNPATQFISSAPQGGTKAAQQARPIPQRAWNAEERRTERVQILLTPSLRKRLNAQAEREGVSINQIVIEALDSYTERID